MSRLTKAARESIVRRIMDDVPQVDYESQAHAFIRADAYHVMPTIIKNLHDDPMLRGWLRNEYRTLPGVFHGLQLYAHSDYRYSDDVRTEIDRLLELNHIQFQLRYDLRRKLEAILQSATTVKRAKELLPEFAEYFPAKDEVITNLPMTVNLAEEFIAAGWSKK